MPSESDQQSPQTETQSKLIVREVGKRFDQGRDGGGTVALEAIDLEVFEGEFVALLGPSGCGKSTLLNIIAGLVPATAGKITLDGRPVTSPGPERGVLFQDYALFPWKSVKGNVEFGLKYGPRSSRPSTVADRDLITTKHIDLVGLTGSEDKYPYQLSGGMRQRVALARLWATDPHVLLMDEPLAALDAQTRLVMQEELLRIWGETNDAGERKTVIYVTHSIEEALFLSDRVVVMATKPGRIKEVIPNNMERPRTEAARGGPRYEELHARIWDLIRDEAYQATVSA